MGPKAQKKEKLGLRGFSTGRTQTATCSSKSWNLFSHYSPCHTQDTIEIMRFMLKTKGDHVSVERSLKKHKLTIGHI